MKDIKILDCTLRDGGYVNNWEFGKENISAIIKGLISSKIDIIECGFLTSKEVNDNQSLYNKVSELNQYLENVDKTKLSLMISNSKYNIACLENYDKNLAKNIRYIFKKHNLKHALNECQIVKSKGYNLFINPTYISEYNFDEFKKLIEQVNKIKPFAFSLVDSIGILDKGSLNSLINYADKNLEKDISLCLHLHNNLGIAFDNAISAVNSNIQRKIIIDSTIRGIGRGSGNLPVELIIMYLNKKYDLKYDIKKIYEMYEQYIISNPKIKLFKMTSAYYFSAINRIHPNYADFVIRNNISDKKANEIFKKIPFEYKTIYNEEIIKALC